MDANKLMPDFQAIGKTDFSKPNIDTKDPMWLITAIGAVLMLIFLFLPWFGTSAEGVTVTRMGIASWAGIFATIGTLATIYGVLYKQDGMVFCGAALSALFALISLFCVFSLTKDGVTMSAEQVSAALDAAKLAKAFGADVGVSIVRYGAILHLIVAAITGAAAYLKIAGIKVFK